MPKAAGKSVKPSLKPTGIIFSLTPQQRQVHEALLRKAPPCADMFFGAVKVSSDAANPERFSQAAHSLRELMDRIGPYLNVPVPDKELLKGRGRLNDKFDEVERFLKKAEKASGNWTSTGWSGSIHTMTEQVLIKLQKCAEWRLLNVKLRKTKAGAIVNKFDPLHHVLPEAIQQRRVGEWEDTYEYFLGVTHHKTTSAIDFGKWLFHFEQLLLRGLASRTRQSLAEMDEIIKAGESK